MDVGVVRVGGVGELIRRRDAARAPHPVQDGGVHLQKTAGRPISVLQTIVDDAGDLSVVGRGGLALHDRGLGQDGLVVRLRHAQIGQSVARGGDHRGDDIGRGGVVRDVVGAGREPPLDVASRLSGQSDGLRGAEGLLDLGIGEVPHTLEAVLHLSLRGSFGDRQGVVGLRRRIQQHGHRVGRRHAGSQCVGARLDIGRVGVVRVGVREGLGGRDDAGVREDPGDVLARGAVGDVDDDLALAGTGIVLRAAHEALDAGVLVGRVADSGHGREDEHQDKGGDQPAPALPAAPSALLPTPGPRRVQTTPGDPGGLARLNTQLGEEVVVVLAHYLSLRVGGTISPAGAFVVRSVSRA